MFKKNKLRSFITIAIIAIVSVVIIAISFLFICHWMDISRIDTMSYQSVFLTNGQVYFGKLSRAFNGDYLLRDVYYLQVKSDLQQLPEGEKGAPQLSLVKLGNELHGPTDLMIINEQYILFWENLKYDSKISQSIVEHRAR